MVRIADKAVWLFVPASTDGLIRREPFEHFEALGNVIGHREHRQVLSQGVVSLVMIFLHGGLFERAVHAFDLPIHPGMISCGQPMGHAMLLTDAIKDVLTSVLIALPIGELDAMIGQHRVDLVGTAAMRWRRKWAAIILLACSCNSA